MVLHTFLLCHPHEKHNFTFAQQAGVSYIRYNVCEIVQKKIFCWRHKERERVRVENWAAVKLCIIYEGPMNPKCYIILVFFFFFYYYLPNSVSGVCVHIKRKISVRGKILLKKFDILFGIFVCVCVYALCR